MEHWVEDVLKSLDNKELVTVEASGNLALRKEHTDEHAKKRNRGMITAVTIPMYG